MVRTTAYTMVNAFDLLITTNNAFSLPVGTDIIIGHGIDQARAY
jgi:hypothetical protein